MHDDRHAWVLTGGRSTRMGADKALVEIAGRALALRVADAVGAVCARVSLVGDPDRYAALGLPVVADRYAGAGPLAGIEAALAATESAQNLVVACDMPSLSPAIVESLFAAGGDCAMPRYPDGKVEPLCAVYHRNCLAAVRAALDAGIRKVTDALRTVEIRYIAVASEAPFANLNTPEDLQNYTHIQNCTNG